ncbi:MAG: hypothetical protein ACP5RW_09145 [bacterium]
MAGSSTNATPKTPSPGKGNRGSKKAGNRKNQPIILSGDPYEYGTVYVGPRQVDGPSQHTFIFGEDDYCISFTVTLNDSKAQDADKAGSEGVHIDLADKGTSISTKEEGGQKANKLETYPVARAASAGGVPKK